ncbi:potassium-transporting ATPase subunit C [Celerinatantimonas yamalensis]|uniref:Potassium-transporting ATPase subunit C n=1 Tax=Celerinatantimonas yamalensis TaxID=559956 RepID=A0ABW9G3B6_9GAMM
MLIAIRTLLMLTMLLGVGYPLLVTLIGQQFWSYQANGSLLKDQSGHVIGSALIGQPFTRANYLHSRPSASHYQPDDSSATNWPPFDAARRQFALSQHSHQPAMMTYSGSGVDPDLPVAAVQSQLARISIACNIDQSPLQALLASQTKSGMLGPKVINVLMFNLALQKICHAR